ncbi:MAG TPA: hypothetical protein VG013_10205 [Gemmataceae bacterium]|jgi:phage FluMu protein Com|nr:hypothetical protein [Gemmataceae bacterium]
MSFLNRQSKIGHRTFIRGRCDMLELNVILDFACCTCERPVSVTLKCTGKGLAAGARTVAAVNVPCPNCGDVNRLYFEPGGTVRDVVPYRAPWQLLEPSVN